MKAPEVIFAFQELHAIKKERITGVKRRRADVHSLGFFHNARPMVSWMLPGEENFTSCILFLLSLPVILNVKPWISFTIGLTMTGFHHRSVVSICCHEIDGVRKEKERLTAAPHSHVSSFLVVQRLSFIIGSASNERENDWRFHKKQDLISCLLDGRKGRRRET